MAKFEIKTRTINIFSNIWWKYVPGTKVTVKWPVGWVVLNENSDGSKVSTESADPNDHYRPWLEKHVGHQGWDWDWRMGNIAASNGHGTVGYDTLEIKFRNRHAHLATMVALRWA